MKAENFLPVFLELAHARVYLFSAFRIGKNLGERDLKGKITQSEKASVKDAFFPDYGKIVIIIFN
jgi:hypothetical protein